MHTLSDDAFVRLYQAGAKEAGYYTGAVDGIAGSGTVSGLKALLAAARAPAPPPVIAVPPLLVAGAARRLDDYDLPKIGDMIGVGEDEVHALMDVEAAGKGFDSKGRVKMLFEPHVFWRELPAGPDRDRAAREGLAYPVWKLSYPADSYPRFWAAYEINPEAAMRSASWGLGQIMGFNAMAAGWASVRKMIEAFAEDEEYHLASMIRFIQTAELDDELRRHDWAGFARGYNGPSYAKNGYDRKLAQAYAKWSRIPDTPYP